MSDQATPAPEPSSSRSLWAGLAHFLSLTFGFMAARFILAFAQISVLTRLLTKDEYGTLTLLIVSVSFTAILLSLGHFEFLVRRLPGRTDEYQWAVLKRVWCFFGTLAVAVAVAGFAGFAWIRPAKVALGPLEYGIAAVYLVLLVYLLQRIFFFVSRAEWIRVRVLQLLYSDTWFLPLLIVALFMKVGLRSVVVVWALWVIVAFALARSWLAPMARKASAETVRIREVLVFGVPLLPLLTGEMLFRLGDRYVLLGLRNAEAVANYTLCLNLAVIVYTVGASALDLFVPEFNKIRNRLPAATTLRDLAAHEPLRGLFTAMLRYTLIIALCGGLFILICGRQLLMLLSGDKYLDVAYVMPSLTLVPLFFLLWVVFNRILLAADKTRLIGGVTLAVAVMNLGLNLLLVPSLGEIGSALSLTTSLAALSAFTMISVKAEFWIERRRLMLPRLALLLVVNAAGLLAARTFLGQHALLCLLAAGAWSLIGIVALRLVDLKDFSPLMPVGGIEENSPYEEPGI
jgi:O-antigen/teichoic acid export membrane protein